MTREEALQRIVDNNFAGEYGFDLQILIDCMVVAREIILNSQFPSEDCISRKEVIKAIDKHTFETDNGVCLDDDITCILEDIPSIQPKAKTEWIPVSERLPKPYQNILVTSEDFHWANEPVSYSVKQKCFGGIVDFIAWMPLPKPYKPTDSESEDKE